MEKLLLASLLISNSLFAALHPHHQRNREIEALIKNDKMIELTSGEQIKEIIETEGGFLIRTKSHEIVAKITYHPTENMGPAKFSFELELLDESNQ